MTRSLCLLTILVASCARQAPSGTLEHNFDSSFIATIPVENKSAVVSAQGEVDKHEMRVQQSEAAIRDAELDVRVAQNRLRQARLEVKACQDKTSVAEKCFDTARIGSTRSELDTARHLAATAQARVVFAEANLSVREQERTVAQARLAQAVAKRELEEARVAAENGISPPGPSIGTYEQQHRTLEVRANEQAQAALSLTEAARARELEWKRMQVGESNNAPRP